MRFPLDLVPPATPPRAAGRGSQHERCGHRGAGQGSPPRSAPAGPGLPVTAAVSACTALTRTCSQNLAFQDEGNGSLRVCDPSERLVPRVHHSPGRESTVPALLALPMTRDGTQRACARGGRASSAAGEGPGADTCDLHAARGGLRGRAGAGFASSRVRGRAPLLGVSAPAVVAAASGAEDL